MSAPAKKTPAVPKPTAAPKKPVDSTVTPVIEDGTNTTEKKSKKNTDPQKEAERKLAQQKATAAIKTALARASKLLGGGALFIDKSPDCYAAILTEYMMDCIKKIQDTECKAEDSYNPYPADKYKLSNIREPQISKSLNLKSTKTSMGVTSLSDAEDDGELEDKTQVPDESAPTGISNTTNGDAKSAHRKKNITTFTRDAKQYINFFIARCFADFRVTGKATPSDESYKKVKVNNRESFMAHALKTITNNKSTLGHVLLIVKRMSDISDDVVDSSVKLGVASEVGSFFSENPSVPIHIEHYLYCYMKILGHKLAQNIWVRPGSIDKKVLEVTMRSLEDGNSKYIENLPADQRPAVQFSLNAGFYNAVRLYLNEILPPPPPKPRVKKTVAGNAAETTETANNNAEPEMTTLQKLPGKSKAAVKSPAKLANKAPVKDVSVNNEEDDDDGETVEVDEVYDDETAEEDVEEDMEDVEEDKQEVTVQKTRGLKRNT